MLGYKVFILNIYLGETHQGWYLLARQLGNIGKRKQQLLQIIKLMSKNG